MAGPASPAPRHSMTVPERRIARVRAAHSGDVMPRKNVAMANAAAWPSDTAPEAMPSTRKASSSSLRASPSRLRRMISWGKWSGTGRRRGTRPAMRRYSP